MRPWLLVIPSAAPLVFAAGACAPVENELAELPPNISTARQCFFVDRINGYGDAPEAGNGRERLYVDTGPGGEWLLETFGPCPEIDWSFAIGLDTRLQSSLCTGETATLLVPQNLDGPANRCTARVLRRVIEQ